WSHPRGGSVGVGLFVLRGLGAVIGGALGDGGGAVAGYAVGALIDDALLARQRPAHVDVMPVRPAFGMTLDRRHLVAGLAGEF
ncbi:MAG TPA: hypothetical protein VL172_14315, partial [Kofleriaceae bacterium]|nr:hypothetical protein [Kofleriaceae bacterium]